ncbi:uncharacterized protein STEHIDRAFT_165281 [Stereum hirsutum FP-91666 SS1]|uniref:uncharacterized protein n=1 Tax=Stereum hirsutum (strain FP-91666) TaxID=721885 RepID=UPI000440C108|nr:uncharacterized protein STEHIDRAFT_165281 [Stereum hirsutum FP-91666 SS1]EIM90768.1 hypothetical protein STEHIDRAFT_165281 [Stereum hirsutum FP-91666 SS1]
MTTQAPFTHYGDFSEDHSRKLMSKEWLARVDKASSVPYLMKFYSSPIDSSCVLLVTDTKTVWAEVLSSSQLARRWRGLTNSLPTQDTLLKYEEIQWREQVAHNLSAAHTLGGMAELTLEPVESQYSDFAFVLEGDGFKWRWETNLVGPKLSARLLSQHLIMPLISTIHLAFTSPEPLTDMTGDEIEKSVDKVGRTARRTLETYMQNAISRPQVATALRRMTALLDYNNDLPPILTVVDKPDIRPPQSPVLLVRAESPSTSQAKIQDSPDSMSQRPRSLPVTSEKPSGRVSPLVESMVVDEPVPSPEPEQRVKQPVPRTPSPPPHIHHGAILSETEPEDSSEDGDPKPVTSRSPVLTTTKLGGMSQAKSRTPTPDADSNTNLSPATSMKKTSRAPPKGKAKAKTPISDSESDSSPVRPTKKTKTAPKSKPPVDEDDSDSDSAPKTTVRRGTRQPVKRGGRRF